MSWVLCCGGSNDYSIHEGNMTLDLSRPLPTPNKDDKIKITELEEHFLDDFTGKYT